MSYAKMIIPLTPIEISRRKIQSLIEAKKKEIQQMLLQKERLEGRLDCLKELLKELNSEKKK